MLQTELETSTDVPNRTDIARAQHLQPDQHQPPPYRHHHLMRTVHAPQRTGASPSPYPHRTLVTPSSHLITTTPPGKMGDLGLPLLSRLAKHPDMASNKTPGSLQAPPELSKGTTRPRHEGPVSKKSAKKRRFNMEQWRDRYMVVDGTAVSWRLTLRPPSLPLPLALSRSLLPTRFISQLNPRTSPPPNPDPPLCSVLLLALR